MSNFVVWKWKRGASGCSVVDLMNVSRVFAIKKGEPAGASFPADAAFRMNPDFKRNTVLIDNIDNVEAMLLCSERLKECIESHQPQHVEYLPVTVLDHKNKPVPDRYFIVHPVEPVDCIDCANSDFTRSAVDKNSILGIDKLVLDESRIGPERVIFKPKGFTLLTLVRRELAQDLDKHGFTGLGWKEVADYVA